MGLEFGNAHAWAYRQGGAFVVALVAVPATLLTFPMWSALALLRFAVAFGGACRSSRDAWERADMAAIDAALSAHAATARM